MGRALKAFALVALLAAAAAAAPERIDRVTGKHTLDHRTTGKRKYDLRVPEGSRSVRIHVKAFVTGGEMRIIVRDAEGRVRQDARLTPSKARPNTYDVETGKERSRAGVWTLEVEMKDALGRYEYTWTADLGD